MKNFKKIVACSVLFLTLIFSVDAISPQNLRLERVSFRKITISWQAPDTTTQIAQYKIYRDGTELAATAAYSFTDETVQPGIKYVYKVQAVIVGGGISEFSTDLSVRTLKSADFENSNLVEEVVDSFHETPKSNLNAISLISAVKSGFEALLGNNISFSIIDENIVASMIMEELTWLNTVSPELTAIEKQTAQAEIDAILDSEFSGGSFDHMYINIKLTELGDKHWEAGNKVAAKLFYEFSFKYLANNESVVSHSLARLAHFAKEHLTQSSSTTDISESLGNAKAYFDRFFDFFPAPASTSVHAKSVLSQPIWLYFSYFPKMLEYTNYDSLFFSTAHEAAKRLVAFDSADKNSVQRLEKIAAWELITLQLRFVDENGNPRTGNIKVCNVSAENGKSYLFSGDAYIDEREFVLTNGTATVPVYAGHDYTISLNVDVANGNKLTFELPIFKYEKNKLVSYDYLSNNFTETESTQSRVDFVISNTAYPYNLRAERGIDVFDLTWDWVAPDNFVTAGFKVYRGATEIAAVDKQTARIPLNNSANEYSYKVVAFDANGNLSAASRELSVYPGDQSQYSDFFDWMNSYFGDEAVYASDDSDNDGIDNYHEFLNNTDPTKVPGPMPYAGPRGFTELTLEWDAVSNVADATYQISRNGTVIGTSNVTKYTDTNLVPGVSYIYKVKLLSPTAVATDWSLPNSFSTQKIHNYEHADKVQQVVDQFLKLNILEYSGSSLVSAVKSSLETLTGSSITFTVVNPDLLEKMVEQEFELLREVSPQLTTAEKIAAKNELNQMMEESWGGNSFEEMYINSKLTELAEQHWQEYSSDKTRISRKTAAHELLEASLLFLTNHESTVRNTLSRKAHFELMDLDKNSTDEQIKNALTIARDTLLRIYNYFPEPAEEHSNPYRKIIANYKKFFTHLLAYNKYDQSIFDNVQQLAAIYRDQNITDVSRRDFYDEISGWKLVQLAITSGLNNGTITFDNVTPNYPSAPWSTEEESNKDTRTFSLTGSLLTVPIYAGHLYDVTIKAPVMGGEDWIYRIPGIKFGSGIKTIANPFVGITVEDMINNNGNSVFVFPVSSVAFPYNLVFEKFPDTFTLSWQYVPSNGTTVDYYNIYRGNILVATSKTMNCSGIPKQVFADGVYSYSVSAVDAAGIESAKSPVIQILPDFSKEEREYFEWKQKYFGDAAVLATDDNDQDGLTNYQEFLLGSNPTISALSIDLSDITGKISGAKINYYTASNTAMPDFAKIIPFKTEVRNDFCFSSTSNNVLGSGKAEQVAFTAEGFFNVATDGYYSFIAKSNDGMKLLINGMAIINHSLIDSPREKATTIYLKSGINSFQIQYFNYRNTAELQINWGAKGGSMKNFALEPVWHLENTPDKLLEYIATRKDSDGDMLSDMDEMRYGTSHLNSDSDGDGLSDYAELKIHFTNPNNADTNRNGIPDAEEVKLNNNNMNLDNVFFELSSEINGDAYVASVGNWEKINTMAQAKERRGSLTYNVSVSNAGIYKLEFSLASAYATGNDNPFDVYVDGQYVASSVQQLTPVTKSFSILTPYLQKGIHTVTIHWDNYKLTEDLLVKKLKIYNIANAVTSSANEYSSDTLSIAEKIVEKRNQVVDTASSRISPFCLIGTSEFPHLTKIDSEAVTVFAENKWMKNIELNEKTSVNATITFENGAITKTSSITWRATDIVAESGKVLTIRKGDSLLLTANADNAASWTATGNGINLSGSAGQNQAFKFETAGEYTITGNCLNSMGDSVKNGTMTVNVVDYQFKRDNVICIVNYGREWNINAIPESVDIKTDTRYNAVFVDKTTRTTPYLKIFVDDNKERYNYAAIDTDGKENIVDVQKIQGIEVSSSNFTGIRQVSSTDDLIIGDDMKVYNMQIIASPVRPDIEFRLNIFVAGVTFADGTVSKSIKSVDFNSNGMCSVDFIRPNEVSTSICHTMKAYQNNEYIGIRQR